MRGFFEPQSVAVVGVSEAPENLGRRIAMNLQEFDFDGIVYLVGPRGGRAFGRRIYKSVSDIPDQVDLAVILVPARHVPDIIDECGHKGIRRAIIESAGFSELGPEGRQAEQRLLEAARRHGMRFIGPNCIGVINRGNGLAVPFPVLKNVFARGGISIVTQSGGVGLDYLNMLASENLGLARFASIGNKLDVDECDLLEFLVADEQTRIICLYLESISDGRRLMRIAYSAARTETPSPRHTFLVVLQEGGSIPVRPLTVTGGAGVLVETRKARWAVVVWLEPLCGGRKVRLTYTIPPGSRPTANLVVGLPAAVGMAVERSREKDGSTVVTISPGREMETSLEGTLRFQ